MKIILSYLRVSILSAVLISFFGITNCQAQFDVLENAKWISIKVLEEVDKDKSILVYCDSSWNKDEIPFQIVKIEDLLKDYGFNVMESETSDNSANFDRRLFEKEVRTKKSNVYYFLKYSIVQMKDYGVDQYFLEFVIYEKESNRKVAYGYCENYRGQIQKRFHKYARNFIRGLESEDSK